MEAAKKIEKRRKKEKIDCVSIHLSTVNNGRKNRLRDRKNILGS